MVNAWSLAASVLDGTLDEDYPIMSKEKREDLSMSVEGDGYEHSEYWYDYTRNDPDRPDPFTDAFDHMMDVNYPSDFTTFSDNDDQIAHHVCSSYDELNLNIEASSPYNDGYTQDFYKDQLKKMTMEKREPKRNHQYKYHETEIMEDIDDYVSSTYNGHYTGKEHEFRNVQTIDLMAARDIASGFCQANILKYGSRYGSKDGRNKKDLLKVIHYAMLLLHFDEHYGKPSMTSGNIDHNMP